MASDIEKRLQPNVYIVGHLKRFHDGEYGSREVIEKLTTKVMARFTNRLLGKKRFKRLKHGKPVPRDKKEPISHGKPAGPNSRRVIPHGKRLVPNAVTLEHADTNPHLNIFLRRPEWISFDDFAEMFEEVWWESPWSSTGPGAFQIEERQPGTKVVGYSLKEGTGALLHGSLTL
jgi:hypothetical protein